MRSLIPSLCLAGCILVLPVRPVLAQCPDGTPPPCRAAPRRPAPPPLDSRTWIVLPFANIARATDIEWLSDASVNLLTLDLSRWQDIQVVDDGRVARLVRELPEGARAQLDLDAALGVARRAGAGMLVTGDLLKEGPRTVIVGKVFDVRTGRRVRTVQARMIGTDSLTETFSRLARGVLGVPPPAGAQLGAVGTSSVEAYREFLAGTAALNAFDTPEAIERLGRAVALDSGFALAHYKLAIALGWERPADPALRRHAEAASMASGDLPARERTLIAGVLAMSQSDYGRSCETYGALVQSDSNDVEALYGLGDCSFHDAVVVPAADDTTRMVFRNSWNASLRAFRRVLDLDPNNHLAFQHIQDALLTGTRPGCRPRPPQTTCGAGAPAWAAAIDRAGDSLVTIPVSLEDGGHALSEQMLATQRAGSPRRNLELARDIAFQWVTAGPAVAHARISLARVLLRLGDVAGANREVRLATGHLGEQGRAGLATLRVEIAVKQDSAALAMPFIDSLLADSGSAGARQTGIVLEAMFGRLRRLDSLVEAAQAPPVVKRYVSAQARVLMGLPVDSLPELERGVAALAGPSPSRGAALIAGTLAFGPLDRAAADWPATDTASADWRVRLVSVLATGDTARSARALAAFDSALATVPDNQDAGFTLLSARAHLLRGDTAAAIGRLAAFADSTWRRTQLVLPIGAIQPSFAGFLWPRTFLLQGELLAARGRDQEAARAYRRVVGMWGAGGPEVQPIVTRVRAALARSGAGGP